MSSLHTLLSSAFLARNEDDFYTAFAALLLRRGFSRFTIWAVEGGTLCKPVGGMNGIEHGLFDIYDIGYSGEELGFVGEFMLQSFDESFPVYAGVFCRDDERMSLAISFHEPIKDSSYRFALALAPFAATQTARMKAASRQLELFVDYQKKLDFIKDSGVIFRPLSRNDAIMSALNYFADAFHAEAACVIIAKEGFFAGTGLSLVDPAKAIFIEDMPLLHYLQKHTGTRYVNENISSEKFNIANIFLVHDPLSEATFALFNISGDIVPDRELSALIAHLISIAIENAARHEQQMQLRIEQAEMEQTVAVIERFVRHEIAIDSPSICAHGVNYPARSTGGDYSTIVDTEDYTFMCLADVCGKGFSAATLTVMLSTVIELGRHDYRDVVEIADDVNHYLLDKNFSGRFITGFFAYFDKQTKLLSYVSCGHEPTLLMRAGEFIELHSRNVPLGVLEEAYEVKEVEIKAGDLLFIYSDGVIEYISHDSLKAQLATLSNMSPKQITHSLYTKLVSDPINQRDDFTCSVIKF
ncbi:MAG: serine/threonine-protein phosphatase [Deferribacteraceae bacterium]|jgi:serine phosphatase RsbU (regulator of sigma subunit)|nr:serine/threonine-protein phosphatase [Deferribacteraceae bacterium]